MPSSRRSAGSDEKGKRGVPLQHAKLDELRGQMRLDKTNALRQSLGAQQVAFTRPQTDRENIMHASSVVSELIATKLKADMRRSGYRLFFFFASLCMCS